MSTPNPPPVRDPVDDTGKRLNLSWLAWFDQFYKWVIGNAGVSQITAGTGVTVSPVGGTGNVTVSANIAVNIHAATNKIPPVGADELGIWDSVSGLLNKLTITNLVAYLTATLGFLPSNYFTPKVWTSGADLVLGIGQSASSSFTAATSMPLHIACGDGQIYEMEILGNYTPAASAISPTLQPNNTVPGTNSFNYRQFFLSGATPSGNEGTDAAGGFYVAVGGSSVYESTVKLYTSTAAKRSIATFGCATNSSSFVGIAAIEWNDNTTVWSSLGTVIMPNAWTGGITTTRIA